MTSATGNGESKRGAQLIAAGFPERAGEQVLVQGASTDAAVRDVARRLGRIDAVTDVAPPRTSADGRSVVVGFKVPESARRRAAGGRRRRAARAS